MINIYFVVPPLLKGEQKLKHLVEFNGKLDDVEKGP
jgi:hypothetical protein